MENAVGYPAENESTCRQTLCNAISDAKEVWNLLACSYSSYASWKLAEPSTVLWLIYASCKVYHLTAEILFLSILPSFYDSTKLAWKKPNFYCLMYGMQMVKIWYNFWQKLKSSPEFLSSILLLYITNPRLVFHHFAVIIKNQSQEGLRRESVILLWLGWHFTMVGVISIHAVWLDVKDLSICISTLFRQGGLPAADTRETDINANSYDQGTTL